MDGVIFGEILKRISMVAITVGVLTGLDLLLGAKVLSVFNKVSDKKFSLDDAITSSKLRISLGVTFLVVCVFLMLLVLTAR